MGTQLIRALAGPVQLAADDPAESWHVGSVWVRVDALLCERVRDDRRAQCAEPSSGRLHHPGVVLLMLVALAGTWLRRPDRRAGVGRLPVVRADRATTRAPLSHWRSATSSAARLTAPTPRSFDDAPERRLPDRLGRAPSRWVRCTASVKAGYIRWPRRPGSDAVHGPGGQPRPVRAGYDLTRSRAGSMLQRRATSTRRSLSAQPSGACSSPESSGSRP